MTARTYAVVGAKGGVGKTTTSINVGATLGGAGYSTVVVELDLAMANVVDFLDLGVDIEEATTVHDVLADEAAVDEACYDVSENFAVVPSGTTLSGYRETDLSALPEAVEVLQWHFDVVILDTPAGLSRETVRPLQLADEALLVSTPRVASVRNAENTLELAWRVDTDVRGLVLTKSGTGASPGATRIADFLGLDLLGGVPDDEAVPRSQDRGKPVVTHAPTSDPAVAYRDIADTLLDGSPSPDQSHSQESESPLESESNSESELDSESETEPETADPTSPENGTDGPEAETNHAHATDGGNRPSGTEPEEDSTTETDSPQSLGARLLSVFR